MDYEIVELREAHLDRKYEVETLQKDRNYDIELIRQELQANAKSNLDSITKLQMELSSIIEVVQKLKSEKIEATETHLEFVHEELAKAIHIIDKHSVEIDELTLKVSYAGKNSANAPTIHAGDIHTALNNNDLRDNLKTLQLHVASLLENVDKLNILAEKTEAHEEHFDTFRNELDEVINAVVDAVEGKIIYHFYVNI